MGLGIWNSIVSRWSDESGEGTDNEAGEAADDEIAETEETEESSFVPSQMDVSVREGHGGHDGEVQRELSDISQRARELEEQRRD